MKLVVRDRNAFDSVVLDDQRLESLFGLGKGYEPRLTLVIGVCAVCSESWQESAAVFGNKRCDLVGLVRLAPPSQLLLTVWHLR